MPLVSLTVAAATTTSESYSRQFHRIPNMGISSWLQQGVSTWDAKAFSLDSKGHSKAARTMHTSTVHVYRP